MLNIPESVKTLFKTDGVHKNFRVQFPNGERDDLTNENVVQESVRFTESLCSQDIFKFGLAEASVLEFETVGVENIYGATIKAGIEIDLSSLSAEEIAAIEAGTWDGELVEVGAGEDYPNLLDGLEMPDYYFRVPYGEFTVESCPRDHQAMTHRKVTAYTVGRLNRSPLEESKLTWTVQGKKKNYRPNAQRLVMAELGWNSPQILDSMTKTQYDAFDTWASDAVTSFWQPTAGVNVRLTVHRHYLPFGNGVAGNALYCLEMQEFDISSVIDKIATFIDRGGHPVDLTPYRRQILSMIENSVNAVIGEFYFTSGLKIFYPHWAQPTSMYIPYSLTVFVGGDSEPMWGIEATGAPFTADPVLYTYDFEDGNIILAYEPTGSVRTSAGKRWTYLNAYDINDIVGGVLETEAAFARVERGGGFGFYHLDDSSPVPVIPGEYENMWFDEYDVEPIGTVRYAYTNKAGEEQVGESTAGDGASVYDMTDNAVTKKMLYGSNDLLENLINTSFVPHIDPINFTPVDLTMKGLPYIQAGDCLEVTAQDGTICKTFVLRQEISGIQALSAQIDSQSGLIIESEDE